VQFAISIPQNIDDGGFNPAAIRGYLARAEELGFASAWTQEQVLGRIPHLGPVETLTYAAACTERMRLGCAVFITSLHSPVHLAKSLSTLDQLAGDGWRWESAPEARAGCSPPSGSIQRASSPGSTRDCA
jgi:alkanesulfonate monooxygenase SsuD/methylene tetrahydromethanopterin reductase-like flavin-dependent oxidoreductase (luciferase family)